MCDAFFCCVELISVWCVLLLCGAYFCVVCSFVVWSLFLCGVFFCCVVCSPISEREVYLVEFYMKYGIYMKIQIQCVV